MSKRRLIIISFIFAFFVCLYFQNYILLKVQGSYDFVCKSDKDDINYNYLYVKKHISSEDLDQLNNKILDGKNGEYWASEMLIHELRFTNDKKYLKQLLELRAYTDTLSDTTVFGNPHTRVTRFYTELDETIDAFSNQK